MGLLHKLVPKGDDWPPTAVNLLQGQVLCLAATMDFLFSGGQDTSIRVWKFNTATSTFDPAVS